MRRKILISLLVLIVLITVAIGVAWRQLENEEFLKSQLHKYTLEYTGRELTFDGPLDFELGRITRLEARGVHFQNAEWASHPEMVSVGRLLIEFDLATLLKDRPVFPGAEFEDCSVFLERNQSGAANWSMGPAGAQPETEAAPEPDEGKLRRMPMWLQDLQIRNCQLEVKSINLEEPLVLKLSELSMDHHDDNRWSGKGSGSLNDMPLSFDGWFAPFGAVIFGGRLEHELDISIGEMSLVSSGTVQDIQTGSGANLSAQIKGPQVENILREFKLPLFSTGEFDFVLRLNTEGDMTRLDLDGDLGSLDARMDGQLDRLVKPTRGDVKLIIDGPNLGALASIFGVDGLAEDAFNHESHASIQDNRIFFKKGHLKTDEDHLTFGGHFSLADHFAGTELDISFNTGEASRITSLLGSAESRIGPLSLDSKLSVNPAGLILLKGTVEQSETTLDVNGSLGKLPGAFHPDLEVSLKSPDPNPLASAWGFSQMPDEPLSVQGRLGVRGKELQLGEVVVDLGRSRAALDGKLNLDNRFAGSDITVDLDIADLQVFARRFGREGLPSQPFNLDGEIKPDGKGLAFRIKDGDMGDIRLRLDGRILDLEQPLGIDGNFDISLPNLNDLGFLLPGTDLPEAPFHAVGQLESRKERVNLKQVTLDLAGNRANVDGHINLQKRYAGSKIIFDLDIRNAHELGLLFGREGLPNQPMQLTASLEPVGKGLAFKVNDGNLGDIELDLDGRIADLDQPTGVDAEFNVKLVKLSDIAFLVPGRELPDIPFTAAGRLVNESTRTRLDQVQITLGQSRASIDGDLLPDQTFRFSITAEGPDVSKLNKLAGTSLPAKPYSLKTALQGTTSKFSLDELDLVLGSSRLTGDLDIGLGDITSVEGKIVSPLLDISYWYPGENAAQQTQPAAAENREWMFDDTPVMRLTEHGVHLDLDLAIDELILGNTNVEAIQLNFLLTHRLLSLSPFTFRGSLGGSYNGDISLDGRSGTPTLNVAVHGKDVRVGLAALPDQDPQTYPPLEVEGELVGAGDTRRELVSSLDGYYVAYMGEGQLATAGMDLLFSDFLTQLFTQLNPFAENSEYTTLECAVLAAEAKSGSINVFPVIFQTEQLTILSEGTVDMNTENIDLAFNTKPRTGLGLSPGMIINPLIKVGGRLTAPAVEIDPAGTLTSGGLAVATVGISLIAKSMSDRFLSSQDPCGDARKEIEKHQAQMK